MLLGPAQHRQLTYECFRSAQLVGGTLRRVRAKTFASRPPRIYMNCCDTDKSDAKRYTNNARITRSKRRQEHIAKEIMLMEVNGAGLRIAKEGQDVKDVDHDGISRLMRTTGYPATRNHEACTPTDSESAIRVAN